MRIAMVSEHASPLAVLGGADAGGQNVHVAALAAALAGLGHTVVVHTRRDDARLPPRVALGPGVEIDHVDAGPAAVVPKDALLPFMDRFAAVLHRRWRVERPHVVHAHFWMSGRAALAAAAPLGVPVVQTFHALGVVKRRHQGGADTSPPERIAVERRLAAGADGIIATCRDEVAELVALGTSRRRVRVVPCGVDLARFTPTGPAEPRPPGRRRIVALGRLVPRKGVDDAIAALGALPDAELIVAGGPDPAALGDDPEVTRLAALAVRLGVAGRVVFRGRIAHDAVPALLRSADVAVAVPWYEPFGIVPLEAMACGVPIVASAVGGHLDTVQHGATGVLVPPRRPDALARTLAALLADDARRVRLGTAGRARVRRRYGWDHVARATLAAYADLAGAPLGRRAPALPALPSRASRPPSRRNGAAGGRRHCGGHRA